MKSHSFLSLFTILFISLACFSNLYAQTNSTESEIYSRNYSDEVVINAPTPQVGTTLLKRHSIDLLLGYGYSFHLNLRPDYKPKGGQLDEYERHLAYHRLLNINIDLGYNFLFNEYYSLGVAVRFITNMKSSFSIVNRVMFPFPEKSLFLYIDFPIGIDLFSLPDYKNNGVTINLTTRFGLSWRITELLGFHSNIGFDINLNSPYKKKAYWHVQEAGVRLSVGMDFSL